MRSLVFLVFVIALPAQAQLWSGIIHPDRATDWTSPGVPGGIPTNRTNCVTAACNILCGSGAPATCTSSGATITNTTIQNAVASAAGTANKVVRLPAGSFTVGALDFGAGRSDYTLRGMGPNLTTLVVNNNSGCTGDWSLVCIRGGDNGYYGPGPPTHIATWTAGYTRGTTTITLSNTTGLSAGMYIVLDACDAGYTGTPCTGSAAVNADDIVNCASTSVCSAEGVTTNGRPNRNQREMIRVTTVSGNNVTLEHGVRYPNWNTASAPSPNAWWGTINSFATGIGIEDLTFDFHLQNGANANSGGIGMFFVARSWIKNVRSLYGPNGDTSGGSGTSHIIFYISAQNTVRDSYFYGSFSENSGPQHYGILLFGADDQLIENNIFQRRTGMYMMDTGTGNVFGYNYAVFDRYCTAGGGAGNCPNEHQFMQASYYTHAPGNGFVLFEGNIGPGFKADVVHGSSNLLTNFRNYLIGWEPGKNQETYAVVLYPFQRFYNFVGNVLGRNAYHVTYKQAYPGSCSGATVILKFGCADNGAPVNDAWTGTSAMLWGNYDTVNDATRFVSSEVPSGIAKWANPVPVSTTLPSSFYLNAKPTTWWGVIGQPELPWPSIGPDVTGQTINGTNGASTWVSQPVGGHVAPNPAMVCYKEIMGGSADGSGGPYTFNANSCYRASASGSTPSIPTGFHIVSVLLGLLGLLGLFASLGAIHGQSLAGAVRSVNAVRTFAKRYRFGSDRAL